MSRRDWRLLDGEQVSWIIVVSIIAVVVLAITLACTFTSVTNNERGNSVQIACIKASGSWVHGHCQVTP